MFGFWGESSHLKSVWEQFTEYNEFLIDLVVVYGFWVGSSHPTPYISAKYGSNYFKIWKQFDELIEVNSFVKQNYQQ